ncbi:hypothetical protein ACJX0J_033181, partial [Zea mays]
ISNRYELNYFRFCFYPLWLHLYAFIRISNRYDFYPLWLHLYAFIRMCCCQTKMVRLTLTELRMH